ncbi:MAG: molybdenum cofactor biosynthesis protein MoaB [Candidatus Omnitrophica bacterium]|nr:molybdenum cofactor biosynthesis protein MoaB [Candidatus Omnitrophota bacterium]
MGHLEHKKHAISKVKCFVLTVSDTRSLKNDISGDLIVEQLKKKGHIITSRKIVKDDMLKIRRVVKKELSITENDAIFINGGTGISKRDCTIEAIIPFLDKKLDGFGELFRYLSYRQIGPSSCMSRALAGVAAGKVIISLPGSPDAVLLAMRGIILPELSHLVWEVSR